MARTVDQAAISSHQAAISSLSPPLHVGREKAHPSIISRTSSYTEHPETWVDHRVAAIEGRRVERSDSFAHAGVGNGSARSPCQLDPAHSPPDPRELQP